MSTIRLVETRERVCVCVKEQWINSNDGIAANVVAVAVVVVVVVDIVVVPVWVTLFPAQFQCHLGSLAKVRGQTNRRHSHFVRIRFL